MARYRFLLTNDDGWDAPGLSTLNALCTGFGEVAVLAPVEPHSYCGHRVTTDRVMELTQMSANAYRLAGSPADCVRAGLRVVFDAGVDWVISGINRGGNLGADIYTSGTVAAAREAALLGLPAVAISQYIRRDMELNWERSMELARPVLEAILAEGCEPKTFWNINLPHLEPGHQPAVVRCEPDDAPLDVRYRVEGSGLHYAGRYVDRARTPGRDVEACFGGAIAVSKLRL